VGHNDAITWPQLASAVDGFDDYFRDLRECGVTCLRLMLEYAEHDSHFFERPLGTVNPLVIATWDQIFMAAERHDVRLLLTPFDTYWMWKRWAHHPYNRSHGGPCEEPRRLLTCPAARSAIKARLAFAIDRWGDSGALFAWDLWNEIHPAYAEDDPGLVEPFVADIAGFVRAREHSRYGRTHLLTVSAFGPLLTDGFHSRELGPTTADPRTSAIVFRHPLLDFATVHTYATGTIDAPANTVDPAVAMGTLTCRYVTEAGERPYLDSEHGPIHTFKDHGCVLPEPFDDEYFRHLQWAHLASGGAGGGMRWPNRHPHRLTRGMHAAQAALSRFLPLIDWRRLRRRNLSEQVAVDRADVVAFCCGDQEQVVLWLLRRARQEADGTLAPDIEGTCVRLTISTLVAGTYAVVTWNTEAGLVEQHARLAVRTAGLSLNIRIKKDVAIAIRRLPCSPRFATSRW
jgi:hypothetical protein